MTSENYPIRAIIALAIVCVVWGTTYLANKYGVMTVPPLFFSGTRMMLATAIMIVLFFKKIKKASWSKKVLLHQILLGFLLITLGNGVGTASLKYLDSGIASVFATLSPMLIVIFNYIFQLEGHLKPKGYLGMLLATLGTATLFIQDIEFYSSGPGLLGLLLFGICLIAWAFGSLFSGKLKSTGHPFVDATAQMFFGGLILLTSSFMLEDASLAQFGRPQWYALAYTVLVGSVITYVSFIYALSQLPATLVSIHSYLNPLIALYVGYLFLGERLDVWLILNTLAILLGVFLISRNFVRMKR